MFVFISFCIVEDLTHKQTEAWLQLVQNLFQTVAFDDPQISKEGAIQLYKNMVSCFRVAEFIVISQDGYLTFFY